MQGRQALAVSGVKVLGTVGGLCSTRGWFAQTHSYTCMSRVQLWNYGVASVDPCNRYSGGAARRCGVAGHEMTTARFCGPRHLYGRHCRVLWSTLSRPGCALRQTTTEPVFCKVQRPRLEKRCLKTPANCTECKTFANGARDWKTHPGAKTLPVVFGTNASFSSSPADLGCACALPPTAEDTALENALTPHPDAAPFPLRGVLETIPGLLRSS